MAHILSFGQAIPAHAINQKSFAAEVAKASNLNATQTRWLERVYKQSAIAVRYSVLVDFSKPYDQWNFWNTSLPTTRERNELYKQHAPILSKKACQTALDEWGQDPKSITHIIYVSCTGIIAPGIQAYLQHALNLSPNVCQFGLNMMGCFGAFKGLEMAHAFSNQNAKNRVLVVCTELCTLHFQQSDSQELQIGNALFADGSAACIVGGAPQAQEKSLYRMASHKSLILPNSSEKMTWDVSDNGFIFGLKKEVPDLIQQHIKNFAKELLPEGYSYKECLWPAHPGGKSILQAIEQALDLTSAHMDSSWEILKQYGNMSSPSFLFVLHHLRQQKPHQKWAVGLGFGPGLCFEGIRLEVL